MEDIIGNQSPHRGKITINFYEATCKQSIRGYLSLFEVMKNCNIYKIFYKKEEQKRIIFDRKKIH